MPTISLAGGFLDSFESRAGRAVELQGLWAPLSGVANPPPALPRPKARDARRAVFAFKSLVMRNNLRRPAAVAGWTGSRNSARCASSLRQTTLRRTHKAAQILPAASLRNPAPRKLRLEPAERIDPRIQRPFWFQPVRRPCPWVDFPATSQNQGRGAHQRIRLERVLGEAAKSGRGHAAFFRSQNLMRVAACRAGQNAGRTVDNPTIGADGFPNWRMTAQP